jgi:peptidoglycan DL-endopeptidase CwlO
MPLCHVRFSLPGFSINGRVARLIGGSAAAIPLMIGTLALTAAPASAAVAPSFVSFHGAVASVSEENAVVAFARAQLGKPYRYGSAGPSSYDCSGLAKAAWAKAGVELAHYTGAQWNEGLHVTRAQLRPGDLVFFGSDVHHVGIYIGGGNMIEAPHTGLDVRIAPAFRSDYVGAVRP